jgi:hypothetical protein
VRQPVLLRVDGSRVRPCLVHGITNGDPDAVAHISAVARTYRVPHGRAYRRTHGSTDSGAQRHANHEPDGCSECVAVCGSFAEPYLANCVAVSVANCGAFGCTHERADNKPDGHPNNLSDSIAHGCPNIVPHGVTDVCAHCFTHGHAHNRANDRHTHRGSNLCAIAGPHGCTHVRPVGSRRRRCVCARRNDGRVCE